MTHFERTIWSAWIAEQIICAGNPEQAESQLALRVGIDFLNQRHSKPVPPVTRHWNNAREDHCLADYTELLRKMAGGNFLLYESVGIVSRLHAAEALQKMHKQLRSVAEIVSHFIHLRENGCRDVSLSKAQELAREQPERSKKKLDKRTIQRDWKLGRKAAHLIFGVCQVYEDPAKLMHSILGPAQRGVPDDVAVALSAARYAKQMLSSKARNAVDALGIANLVQDMAEPTSFVFSSANPSAISIFDSTVYDFKESNVSKFRLC